VEHAQREEKKKKQKTSDFVQNKLDVRHASCTAILICTCGRCTFPSKAPLSLLLLAFYRYLVRMEDRLRDLEVENRRLRAQLAELQARSSPSGSTSSEPSEKDIRQQFDTQYDSDSSSSEPPTPENPSGTTLKIYPVFSKDRVQVVASIFASDTVDTTNLSLAEISSKVEAVKAAKKKKKPHKKNAEARKRQKAARKQRKLLVVAQSDASVLLPEGEQGLRKLKLETRQKLLTRFKEDIKTIEKPPHLEEFISSVIGTHKELESFYLCDLGCVIRQKDRWDRALPRIRPYYAVKSNPDARVVKTLMAMGAGFDCASKNEIVEVLSLGAPPSDIIFANPCKARSHILFAKEKGVLRMTFDNAQEVDKVHEIYPEAHLVLRLLPDDSHSSSPLGSKFGAATSEWAPLMDKCIALKMNLIGVSFHVGSGNWDTSAHTAAINLARQAFDLAASKGLKFTLLDIGGGWPGTDDGALNFDTIATAIKPQIDELFPPEVEVISEPGRYFCTEAYTLAVSVISKREKFLPSPEHTEEQPVAPQRQILYYMSEGLYGSFNNIIFDHFTPSPLLLKQPQASSSGSSSQPPSSPTSPAPYQHGDASGKQEEHSIDSSLTHSKLFGPTCDSIDVIIPDIQLPELEVGAWLYFINMGAYTASSASSFNGFSLPNAFHFVAL
jgi:ornithine decarboxylase